MSACRGSLGCFYPPPARFLMGWPESLQQREDLELQGMKSLEEFQAELQSKRARVVTLWKLTDRDLPSLHLPEWVEVLVIFDSSGRLSRLPALPQALQGLVVLAKGLRALPPEWPPRLQYLYLSGRGVIAPERKIPSRDPKVFSPSLPNPTSSLTSSPPKSVPIPIPRRRPPDLPTHLAGSLPSQMWASSYTGSSYLDSSFLGGGSRVTPV